MILVFFLLFTINAISQNDSLPYERYKNNVVLYTDYGYTSGPFSIKYNFPGPTEKLKYRNNYKDVVGFGICYKWFSFRISFALQGNAKSVEKYGKTTYFATGTNFTLKRFYWDIDIRSFGGYAIKNAYHWNDTLSPDHPNDIRSNTKSYGLSINTWYFQDKNFKMSAVLGKTGHYLREVKTWYFKTTFNSYGIKNENGTDKYSIIPTPLIDPLNSKTASTSYASVDMGVIPGYAYVNRKNNWQIAGLFGVGAVLQTKFYNVNGNTRGFVGLAPRYDIRFIGGYSVPRYFVFLVTEFDNKSIRFNDFVYKQTFYSIKLVAGVRFKDRKKEEKEKEKKKKK